MNFEEAEANPADAGTIAPATPAPEASEEVVEDGSEDSGEEFDELEALLNDTGEPEAVEVEYEGKKYNVPKELSEALLRQSDYTKKTMDVAEQRKALEAKQAELETFRNISEQQFSAAIELQQARQRLQQLEQTQIGNLSQEQINALRLDYSDTQRQVEQLANHLGQLSQAETTQRDQLLAKAREDAIKAAAKAIPNFTDERRSALIALAADVGKISESDLGDITHPGVYTLLHYADIGKKFEARQRKAAKVESAQATTPVPEVRGRASARKDPSKMTPEEYHAMRMKQRGG